MSEWVEDKDFIFTLVKLGGLRPGDEVRINAHDTPTLSHQPDLQGEVRTVFDTGPYGREPRDYICRVKPGDGMDNCWWLGLENIAAWRRP